MNPVSIFGGTMVTTEGEILDFSTPSKRLKMHSPGYLRNQFKTRGLKHMSLDEKKERSHKNTFSNNGLSYESPWSTSQIKCLIKNYTNQKDYLSDM